MGTEESYHYDEVTLLTPFAVGMPGKRTFFLAIGEKNKWLRVWLEKEHLKALSLGIEQLLSNLSKQEINIPRKAAASSPDDTPTVLPSAELDILQMALGYEDGKAVMELLVQKSGAHEPAPLEVSCRATLAQFKKFADQADRLYVAGRPLCKKCGGPIDPSGHVCPTEN